MIHIGKLLGWILLGVNTLIVVFLFLSAYSPYFQPQAHPLLSCIGLAFPIFWCANFLFLLFWSVVYRKYIFLSLLAIIGCWDATYTYCPINLFPNSKEEGTIKILSFNTEAFSERKPHTKESPNPILSYLANSHADIICLQECVWGNKLQKKDINYALKEYPYKHHYSFAKDLNGLGCYSRYPILSATPIKYKSYGNGSIVYRIKVDKDTLIVINNHLESFKIHDSDIEIYHSLLDTPNNSKFTSNSKALLKKLMLPSATRAQQVDSLVHIITNSPEQKIIVCGDFNDSPISYTHRRISQHLQDAFKQSGNGLGISYHENRFYFRIDHIFLSKNMKSYECTVDRSINASDHYPIWCYISLE